MPNANVNLIDFLLDGFSKGSELSQYVSLYQNLTQSSNDEIMKELQHQNSIFLSRIIKQNQEIIRLLGGEEDV